MKKSVINLLGNLNNGGKVSNRVHQETLETAKSNGWIEWTSEGWKITDSGYKAWLLS